MSKILVPKIDNGSILGIATAISGKRQEMDSAIACPTPLSLGNVGRIYTFKFGDEIDVMLSAFSLSGNASP